GPPPLVFLPHALVRPRGGAARAGPGRRRRRPGGGDRPTRPRIRRSGAPRGGTEPDRLRGLLLRRLPRLERSEPDRARAGLGRTRVDVITLSHPPRLFRPMAGRSVPGHAAHADAPDF